MEAVEAVEEGEEGEGEEVAVEVTIPHWVWSVSGHLLEQKSGQGCFQSSLETWGFSRY